MDWLKPALRLLFFTRFSILVALAATVLVPFAASAKPELIGSLLVLEDPWQLFNVTWASLTVAIFVLVSFRLTQVNAAARFPDYKASLEEIAAGRANQPAPQEPVIPRRVGAAREAARLDDATVPPALPANPGWRYRWLLLALIGLTLPLVSVYHTSQDLSAAWTDGLLSPGALGALAMLGGTIVALLMLAILLVSQQLLLDPKAVSCDLLPFELWPWFERLKQIHLGSLNELTRKFACWMEVFGPGYTQRAPDSGEVLLAPGHSQSALWLSILLGVYLYSYHGLLSGRNLPAESGPFSALFFFLLLLLLLHGLLTGLAFFLDYYRVPVLFTVIVLSVISSSLFDTEHVYELKPPYNEHIADKSPPPLPDLELTTLFDDWHPPRRTLVVVSAAGGGIQAAAWTTQVLAGLDEIYGPDFTRSIGMVSGVSGGSVGTMYYMASGDWTATGAPFTRDSRSRMIESAEASSLEATGWGIVYPDFMRSFVPWLVPRHVDRGWAIEQSWLGRLGVDHRLRDWIPAIRNHQMPIPVFNAVLAETGQRLIISPVLKKKQTTWSASDPCEFFNLYPGDESNLRATTAARLSATFPYVSPISRGDGDDTGDGTPKDYHVADGGYAENEGILTILDWMNQLVKHYDKPDKRPFDRILVIRIQPFSVQSHPAPADPNKGWTYDVLGPLDTLQNVRSASQAERDDFDLNLLAKSKDSCPTEPENPNQIEIIWTNFMFHPGPGYITPFSWHLTTSQKSEIHEGWRDVIYNWNRANRPRKSKLATIRNHRPEDSPLATVDLFFPRVIRRSGPLATAQTAAPARE
jgi:hypothetical protein